VYLLSIIKFLRKLNKMSMAVELSVKAVNNEYNEDEEQHEQSNSVSLSVIIQSEQDPDNNQRKEKV